MDTYDEAQRDGKKLLEALPGKGWRLKLWENLGWQYSAQLGPLSVNPSPRGGFFCLLSDTPGDGAGLPIWDAGSHRKPSVAVEIQMRKARKVADKLNRLVADLEKALRRE